MGSGSSFPSRSTAKTITFLVDTGSSTCIVDATLRSHLVPTGRTEADGRDPGYQLCRICKAHLGKARLPVVGDVVCADLSWLRHVSDCEFYGILGMTFLKAFVLQIDFQAGKFSIRKSGPESAVGAQKLGVESGCPTIGCEISAGQIEQFLVDTGMEKGVVGLDAHTAQLLQREGRFDVADNRREFYGIHGAREGRAGTIDRLRIADFENSCQKAHETPINKLGLGYLSQIHVTFDFPNNSLYLKRTNRDVDGCRSEMSGLRIARVDDTTIVGAVRAGSPAHSAGLQAGDRIMRFGETDSGKFGLVDISELFSKERRRLSLVVQRDDVSRTVEFELSDWQRTSAAQGTALACPAGQAPELARDSRKPAEEKESVENDENPHCRPD